ncbi:MAG TPA: LPS assembly protein LptD [Vicinamibacteria bacterium]|nr:LPS assembly protein LptD [Vicinamibacteria bacterium]
MSRPLSSLLLIVAVALLAAAPARGQGRRNPAPATPGAATPGQTGTSSSAEGQQAPTEQARDKGKKRTGPEGEEAIPEGEMRVKAESYEQRDKGHIEARGMVDLRLTGMRVLADKADVYEEKQEDGSVKRRMVADGNVVFIRGDERLSGDHLEMDDTGKGFLTNAVGFVEPGVFVEGRRVTRKDDRTYLVEGGRFTACEQPNPRWKISSTSATIEVDDKIIARNAVFWVKGVPSFYTPWIAYPIEKNGRSTGFLFPHFSHSTWRGFGMGTGFFWAMGRSADQTFYFDAYTKSGFGFGHELRYASDSPSRGVFRTYVFRLNSTPAVVDPTTGEVITPGSPAVNDYDIDWNALQMAPGKIRVALNLRKYSDLQFRQRFQDNFNLATTRTQRYSVSLEKDLKLAVLTAYTDDTNTYYGDTYQRINGHLPGFSLRRFPRQVGWGGIVFGMDSTADHIRYGDLSHVDNWWRFDLSPTLSRPFNLTFLDVNPSVSYRFTRYGSTNGFVTAVDEEGNPILDDSGNPKQQAAIVGPPLNRSFFETSIDIRGPTFQKVFDTPDLGYSKRWKHTIGPEITWRYRTRVEDANAIPKFDSIDYMYGTDEVQYALVQRIFAKRPTGRGDRTAAWTFFEWRLMQTYYVKINEAQNNFDPNYASSSFGPGNTPAHLSPLSSRMRLRPTAEYSFDYTLEYNVNFQQLQRMSGNATINTGRVAFSAGWSRSLRTSVDPTQRTVGSHTVRATTSVDVLPRRLELEGGVDYDLVRDILYNLRGQVRYGLQCCGIKVEYIRYNWNTVVDSRWHFNIELANIGSMGNFLGSDSSRQGLGGYR